MAREWYIKLQMVLTMVNAIATPLLAVLLLKDGEYIFATPFIIIFIIEIQTLIIHRNLWKYDESITNDIKDMDKRINIAKIERKARKNGRKLLAKRMSNNVVKQWIIRLYFVLVREMDK